MHTLPRITKSFREKSSYVAILLSCWRWWEFLIVLFHALLVVSADIVAAGGLNITGIVDIDPVATLIHLTACFMTVGVTRLLLTVSDIAMIEWSLIAVGVARLLIAAGG